MGSYSILARRFIRQQVDGIPTPSFATAAQVSSTFDALRSGTAWRLTPRGTLAVLPVTGSENTEGNMAKLDHLDAFAFCTGHTEDGQHILRMGLAAYRLTLPDAFVGAKMDSVTLNLHGDPFLRDGAVVGVAPSAGAQPAADWAAAVRDAPAKIIQAVARGEVPAPTPSCPSCKTWFARSREYALGYGASFEDGAAGVFPQGGVTLAKYLFIYVAMANYQRVRNAWVEGSAMMNSVIRFTASGPGLPPDGVLPDGEQEAFAVARIDDTTIGATLSNVPYEGLADPPVWTDARFGQGAYVGLNLFAAKELCASGITAEDFERWAIALRGVPSAHTDLVAVSNTAQDSGKIVRCWRGGVLAYMIPNYRYGETQYNTRGLVRRYQKTLVRLQGESAQWWLLYAPTKQNPVCVSSNARITLTLWFLPVTALGNTHPDRYVMDKKLHKNPSFWSGGAETLDGLIRLGGAVIPNRSWSVNEGFPVPVAIPPALDSQSGILFMAPDIEGVVRTQPALGVGVFGSEPSTVIHPLADGGEVMTQASGSAALNDYQSLLLAVYNGRPANVIEV
jgi:hypothetical protein